MADLTHTQQLLDQCTRCGLCLNDCPTYVLSANELESPRGRISLLADAAASGGAVNSAVIEHIDSCLGCLSCMSSCPEDVRFDQILEASRPAIEHVAERSAGERAVRLLIDETLPYPKRLQAMVPVLAATKRIGAQRLPERAALLAKVAPAAPSRQQMKTQLPSHTSALGTSRGRIGLLLGCVQRVFFGDVHRATVGVLAAEGYDVFAPSKPDCCGSLELHSGESEAGLARAEATIAAFNALRVEAVVTNSAGCGSTMKRYGELLRNQSAEQFAATVSDVTEFLAGVAPRAKRGAVPMRVVYQDACHLRHGQGVIDEPRALLAGIPALDLVELPESEAVLCCGSAGVYNMLQPDTADALGQRKARVLLDTGAEAIVSANPGCAAQLARHTKQLGRELPVLHPIELLWRSIQAVQA